MMKNQSPFLDVSSFVTEEIAQNIDETFVSPVTPFLPLYESEDGSGLVNPEMEEFVSFLNELYDEEFDDALYGLVTEAVQLYETQFLQGENDVRANGPQAERMLLEHFTPLFAEVESMLDTLAAEFAQHEPSTLNEDEIEAVIDRYEAKSELSPAFEEAFGKLKSVIKKVANKAVSLAKKGAMAVATGGLSLVLPKIMKKIKPLIKPLVKRVIQMAIGKLPPTLQPIAKKLAEKLPFLKEYEEEEESAPEFSELSEVAVVQQEFNEQIANLLFARSEVELELEMAEYLTEQSVPDIFPLADLECARNQLVENLGNLQEGEDPTPHIENFIPALLPALRLGVRLIGRKRVVKFLANLLAKLIQKFVGPQYSGVLSTAIVDIGLRLLQMETTAQEESQATAKAVAAALEETITQVAEAPEYVFESPELLEGLVYEAFEQAAAANLPPVLPKATYRRRPDLAENKRLGGIWIVMPLHRFRKFKKYSRRIPVKLTPHKVAELEGFEGISLGEMLEEQYGIAPGEEFDAVVHLYEAIPGSRLSDIAQEDETMMKVSDFEDYRQLHPLTREAAELLLGDPEVGRDRRAGQPLNAHKLKPGQRVYRLQTPGRRPIAQPGPTGRPRLRRVSRVRLVLDFSKNSIRIYLFLGESRSQDLAVKLRQNAHLGPFLHRMQNTLERGLRSALTGTYGRLKIIHGAISPARYRAAIQRLPAYIPQELLGRIISWVMKEVPGQLQTRSAEYIKAAEDAADGVTLVITLADPPGFLKIRQALKGKTLPLSELKLSQGTPTVSIKIAAGRLHE